MTTTLVNRHTHPNFNIYIGRGTPFGNPYIIGQNGTRDQVIALYKIYFYQKLSHDPAFAAQVESLRGKILSCSCSPKKCHGDIIIEYLENTEPTRKETPL